MKFNYIIIWFCFEKVNLNLVCLLFFLFQILKPVFSLSTALQELKISYKFKCKMCVCVFKFHDYFHLKYQHKKIRSNNIEYLLIPCRSMDNQNRSEYAPKYFGMFQITLRGVKIHFLFMNFAFWPMLKKFYPSP